MNASTYMGRTSSRRRSGRTLLALLVSFVFMAGLSVVSARLASAETLTVTNTDDSGPGSLREAIDQANYAAGDDTIVFALAPGSTIELTSPLSPLTTNIELDNGTGARALTVRRSAAEGTPDFRIFYVGPGARVGIKGLIISNGKAVTADGLGEGGGILSDYSTLTLTNATVSNNTAGHHGGGIVNGGGTLTLNNTTVSNNTARYGGGIFGDQVTLNNSTVSNNIASTDGGGFYGTDVLANSSTVSGNAANQAGGGIHIADGRMTLTNTTVSNNTAYIGGGLVNHMGTMTLTNATVSNNTAQQFGGGVVIDNDISSSLGNTIVADNTSDFDVGSKDVWTSYGTFDSRGHNLIGVGGEGIGFVDGQKADQVGTALSPIDPKLGTLADNGGPTLTRALLDYSPAINAGADALAVGPDGAPLGFDQRGEGYPRKQGIAVDIGAFESDSEWSADDTPPRFTPEPADITVAATSADGALVTYDTPTAYDDGDGAAATVTCDRASGSLFPIGTTTVTCTATDSKGNTAQTSFLVTVRDVIAPTIVDRSPGDDQTDVPKTANVTVTFSEKVQGIDGTTFKLERLTRKGFEPVDAAPPSTELITDQGEQVTKVVLEPTRDLHRGNWYRVTVTSGVSDMASPANQFAGAKWDFKVQ